MSAIAGRVLQIHKGAYDAATAYSPLDEVLYQGSTYVCKQNSTGNLPTNTTYWQLVAQKGDAGEIQWADNTILGAKNFMFTTQTTHTTNGGTWTIDSETGVITASGTPTGYSDTNFIFPLTPGIYRIGRIENGVNISWGGYELHKNGQTIYTYSPNLNDGQVIDLTSYDFDEISMSVKRVANNSPISGTVYPMLRLADDTDDTYAPYAMTNRELTDRVKQSKENIITTFKSEVVISGSNITNVEWARKLRYGNIMIFQARINKASNTDIWAAFQCPLTFPETFYDNSQFTLNSPYKGGTGTFDIDTKKLTFRYSSDEATYVDMQMIAIVK